MTVQATPTNGRQTARSRPAHQAYLTHCLITDSVLHSPGFSVRAASTTDEELLQALERHPAFELPVALWSRDPAPDQAPRRLSLVQLADQQAALIHSSYLQRDTVGRRGNHFTHVLVGSNFELLEAIRSWAAPGWRLDYPSGEDKVLPTPHEVPTGDILTDEVVSDFLSSGTLTPDDADLATLILPERLKKDGQTRRQLVGRFLQGVLVLVREGERRRGPLYIHAEPGLLALLLYVAARLLPRGWSHGLTFSTYESPDTALRSFTQALVVGTYLDNPQEKLEVDFVERYGYGIDAFHPGHCSTELAGRPADGLEALLDLAAHREWEVVDRLHERWGLARIALPSIRDDVRKGRAAARIHRGDAAIDDLLVLQEDADGRRLIDECQAEVWPAIRDGCLANPKLAERFRSMLSTEAHLKELRGIAASSLADEDLPAWQRQWNQVRALGGGDERAKLRTLIDEARLAESDSMKVRSAVRRDWLTAANGETPPWPRLLQPLDAAELDVIMGDSTLPIPWKAIALCQAALTPKQAGRARDHLEVNDKELFALVLKTGQHEFNRAPDQLARLLGGQRPAHALMDHLLEGGTKLIEVPTWIHLVHALNALEAPAWKEFWFDKERLTNLLATLGNLADARDIWVHCLKRFDRSFLGDERQIILHSQLCRALSRIERNGGVNNLIRPEERVAIERRHLQVALYAPKSPALRPLLEPLLTPLRLQVACNQTKQEMLPMLRNRFSEQTRANDPTYARLDPRVAAQRERLNEFRDAFLRFHEMESVDDCQTAFVNWCQIARGCPPDRLGPMQEYFFDEVKKRLTVTERYELINKIENAVAVAPALSHRVRDDYFTMIRKKQEEEEARRPIIAAPGETTKFVPPAPARRDPAPASAGISWEKAQPPVVASRDPIAFDSPVGAYRKPGKRRASGTGGKAVVILGLLAALALMIGGTIFILKKLDENDNQPSGNKSPNQQEPLKKN